MTDELQKHRKGWWIDLLERELDPILEQDLIWLLNHSAVDRQIVQRYAQLRHVLKACNRAEVPTEEEYYAQLHSRVMKGIDELVANDQSVEASHATDEPRSTPIRV